MRGGGSAPEFANQEGGVAVGGLVGGGGGRGRRGEGRVSVIILRGLFKVRKSKPLCRICQHLHAIIVFALSVSLQMFLFLSQCLQEWPSRSPPAPPPPPPPSSILLHSPPFNTIKFTLA